MASGSSPTDEVVKQLKVTNRLLAAQLKSEMSQMDLVALLDGSGLTAREIGEILGTSGATVAVTLQRIRKRGKKTEE